MVADGTLKINYNTDFLEEDDFESKTESEKLDTVADELITDIPHNQRISATLRIPEQTQNIRDVFS